jgi:hypothetical protein
MNPKTLLTAKSNSLDLFAFLAIAPKIIRKTYSDDESRGLQTLPGGFESVSTDFPPELVARGLNPWWSNRKIILHADSG